MIRTQIQLTEEQSQQLKEIALVEKVSVAELIRRSVDQFLETQVDPLSYEERRRKALAVIGIASSGLGDLGARHDEYLAQIYGEVGESGSFSTRQRR
jgi:hypothetical protein